MKYLFMILLFCLCVFVGYYYSSKFSKRKKFYSSLISFADKLALEINFSRERLKVLTENFDASTRKNLLGIDEGFVEYLDKKGELTTENIFKKAQILTKEEKENVLLFLKILGRSDVENQTKEIKNFVSRFEETRQKCDQDQKKYGSLALKLGIIAGLFCVIILI